MSLTGYLLFYSTNNGLFVHIYGYLYELLFVHNEPNRLFVHLGYLYSTSNLFSNTFMSLSSYLHVLTGYL